MITTITYAMHILMIARHTPRHFTSSCNARQTSSHAQPCVYVCVFRINPAASVGTCWSSLTAAARPVPLVPAHLMQWVNS